MSHENKSNFIIAAIVISSTFLAFCQCLGYRNQSWNGPFQMLFLELSFM